MVGHHRVQRLSVVPYTSKRLHRIMMVVVVAGYFLVGWAGYWVGTNNLRLEVDRSLETVERLKTKNDTLSGSVQKLRSESIQKQQEVVVERQTIELVRQENMELQNKVNALEKEVAFFHRIVKTSDDAKGVAFGKLQVTPSVKDHFNITVDMMQISGRKKVSGKLYIKMEGVDQKGKKLSVDLPVKLSDQSAELKALPLGFVSYQTVTGIFKLPDGLLPKTLLLTAKITGGKKVTLNERYPWQGVSKLSE